MQSRDQFYLEQGNPNGVIFHFEERKSTTLEETNSDADSRQVTPAAMQPRQSDQHDFLYVLKTDEIVDSARAKLCSIYQNGVILYPDPDDRSCSSSGARKYKACFIQNGKLLTNTNGEPTEVSIGNQLLLESGLISKDTKNYAELIKKAYHEKLTYEKSILADMQGSLQAYDHPRYEHALGVKRKQEETSANEKVIFHVATEGVEEPKSNILEETKSVQSTNKIYKVNNLPYSKSIINSNDPRLKKTSKPEIKNLPFQVIESAIGSYLQPKDICKVSTSCVTLYAKTSTILEKNAERAFSKYLQAIVFNSPLMISPILDAYPHFLLEKPKDHGITEIECQHTWLRIKPGDKTTFGMAQELRHIDAMKAMFPHYEKKLNDARAREDKSAITALENAWTMRLPTEDEQKALRKKYTDELIMPVITALAADTTLQTSWVTNPETGLGETKIDHASDATLNALKKLKEKLFEPKTLEDCIDVNQFLIALYEAYDTHFNTFQNWHQQDAYAVLCIGVGQSIVGHDLGERFCQGFYNTVYRYEEIGKRAKTLVLPDGRSFYREQPDSLGLGSSFLCSIYGGRPLGRTAAAMGEKRAIGRLCQANAAECIELTQRVHQKQSRCVIS